MSRSFRSTLLPYAAILAMAGVWTLPLAAKAAEDPAQAALWAWNGRDQVTLSREFTPFDAAHTGGSLAVGDLGKDGSPEIVVGAAVGQHPLVKTLRSDGSLIFEFAAYGPQMHQGVNVAIGDLDGDGIAEIVTSPGPGSVAHVVVYDASGKMKLIAGGFYPYGKDSLGGSSVAVADLDGDGRGEIITGAGPGAGPLVKAWKADGRFIGDFFAFDSTEWVGGANIAAGDIDGDGRAEILAATGGGYSAIVRIFDGTTFEKKHEFEAIGNGFRGGLNLAVADAGGDGIKNIIIGTNGGGGPQVSVFDPDGTVKNRFFAYDQAYMGGVFVGAGHFSDGTKIVTLPAGRTVDGRPQLAKYIHVDVSEQMLRAYEYGRLTKAFPVSTGTYKTPTPNGTFAITHKPLFVHYAGTGYDLGIVKWNMRFLPHFYIHYAPWHNNFGRRMSHGCVNVSRKSAEWIYNWSEVGTEVTVAD